MVWNWSYRTLMLRPRKSAPARRTRDSSGASYPTLPSRAIQAPGPRCQPAWAPESAADRQNTLENPGVLGRRYEGPSGQNRGYAGTALCGDRLAGQPGCPARDDKRGLRPTGGYTEERLEMLTNRIVDVTRSGS